MPARPKTTENMTKNLTRAEREAGEAAEAATLPDRPSVNLNPPGYIKTDKAAFRYWSDILDRMDGISILDDLDTEILAVYCSMLTRRDSAHKLLKSVLKETNKGIKEGKLEAEDRIALLARIDALMAKIQGQERTILQYADKLGLTPSGRVSLARKRAQKAAGEAGDTDDLFGD